MFILVLISWIYTTPKKLTKNSIDLYPQNNPQMNPKNFPTSTIFP